MWLLVGLSVVVVPLALMTEPWVKNPVYGDFATVQTGAQCLVAGCDPYDSAGLNAEAKRRGQQKPFFEKMAPVYPSSAMLLLLPFEGLDWPLAGQVFVWVSGLLLVGALGLLIWRMRVQAWDAGALILLAGLAGDAVPMAVLFGNPGLITSAMATLGCLLLLTWPGGGRDGVASGLLGCALALKPQLVVGPALVLLVRRETRRAGLAACGVAAALLLAGVIGYRLRLGSFTFLHTLQDALALSMEPGGTSDYANSWSFDFLNLQRMFWMRGLSRDASATLAWSIAGVLGVTAVWVGRRTEAPRCRPWTMIALATGISLLPVYHRGYDRVIGLLLIPAATEVAERSRWLAWVYGAVVAMWLANETVMHFALRRLTGTSQNGVEDVLFCMVLLVSLGLRERRERLTA